MTEVEQLLKKLILIPSPSGNENGICNFVFKLLEENGFDTKKIQVDDNGFNVIATLGKPKVFLAAHLDTVSPFLDYKETETDIFGRGACDTKGCVAGMLTTALECKKKGFNNFGLIFTVGEETDFRGAKKILESGVEIPFVIVGEPTCLEIVNGHFGILIIKLSAKGKTAHSSQPDKGINAINLLLKTVFSVNLMPVHPESLMSLVQINGGLADNIIPDNAEAIFSFRISPEDKEDYVKKIQSLATEGVCPDKQIEIESVYTDVPEELDFIKGRKVVKYCTELSFFKNGVVLGPGDIGFAHGSEEHISKKELIKSVEIYSDIIKNFTK